MTLPKVSIITPVYNASKFLRDAIESILAQSFKDFELILINDGSTDYSETIIKSFTDNRIRYHYQQNAGVAAALNKGIELAKGTYIWRHDADDISLPTKLEQQVRFLQMHPEFFLCAVQVAFMTERGMPAWNYRQPKNTYFGDAEFKEVKREHFAPYSPITHGTVLMLREAVDKLGGYRKEFITGEDVDLWLRFIQNYKAAVLNQCLSLHRLSGNSATKVHGWKNDFFRNLAFKYYDQREQTGKDELEESKIIVLPEPPVTLPRTSRSGRKFRDDLLQFNYELHLDAKDWRGVAELTKLALADGWKHKRTWKALLLPLIGRQITASLVRLKKKLHAR